jgi:hypothetical protein
MLLSEPMRSIIHLSGEQAAQLQTICGREAVSPPEALRRAIGLYIAQELVHQDALSAAFGLWAQDGRLPVDGVAYQQAMRAGTG